MDTLIIFDRHWDSSADFLANCLGTLTLPFEQRQKTRQRAQLDSGIAIGIQLTRGTILRGGDRLAAGSGEIIEVIAGRERVSTVYADDGLELTRAAYHLGNRHIALQVGEGWLRYLADHVLDAMVIGLGLSVTHEEQPFEPEAGAYEGGQGRSHGHGHGHRHNSVGHHDDDRGHSHNHGHNHSHEH